MFTTTVTGKPNYKHVYFTSWRHWMAQHSVSKYTRLSKPLFSVSHL